jgi:ribose/xylose/arabinose/galactoside ABC-type transport system permease subunit
MVAGRGLAQLLTDGQIVTVYYQPFFFLGSGYLFGLPFSLYMVAAVFIVTALLMRKTALGLFIQAVGINPVAARLAGLRTATLIFFVYVFCSACAGLAGLMITRTSRARTPTTPACCSNSTPSWPSRWAAPRWPAANSAWPAA